MVWNLADVTMGFMAIVNIAAILLLGNIAIHALEDYEKQKKTGEKIPCSMQQISAWTIQKNGSSRSKESDQYLCVNDGWA